MKQALPRGTVTFLFTDIEGSTRLLHELGERYADVLAEHRRLLRAAFSKHGGVEVDTQGDAFFVAFARASDALAAAREGQAALNGEVRVRMGVHTGEPLVTDEGYVGIDVHRAARIASAGHGGQVLVSQSTRELCGPAELRDLGLHRLKDLTAPERIFQLGDGEFPRLKSLHQTNLPVQPTPLVGRERELAEVVGLVRSHRLVTLTGAGGSGKTRLALQAAAEVADEFPDGVWFVSLAAVTDAALVESTVASVVGAKDDLNAFLRERQLLLLLDNVEQLLPAAAPLVANLHAKVMATSRERLNVYGEQEYPVPTLPLDEAVALFTARARQLKPSFEPDDHVAEIAKRLDGLPLALELAAARIKVLTTEQILDRLGHSLDLLTTGSADGSDRQRTLRGTIGWSYDLLAESERAGFVRCAVFPGSFDLKAAEAVCGASIDELHSLIDKSLVRKTEAGRFFLLETIREFASEHLLASSLVHPAVQQHVEHFYELSEQFAEALAVRVDGSTLERMDQERANFRACFAALFEAADFERLAQCVSNLGWLWIARGPRDEATRWFSVALEHVPADRADLQASLKAKLGDVAFVHGDFAECERLLGEALQTFRAQNDLRRVASALVRLSQLSTMLGKRELATQHALEAERVAREAGDERRLVTARSALGNLALYEGDYSRARELFQSTCAKYRESGDDGDLAMDLACLATAELLDGEPLLATANAKEALPLLPAGGVISVAHGLELLAAILVSRKQFEAAATILASGAAVCAEHGIDLQPLEQKLHEDTAAAVEAALGSWLQEPPLSPDDAVSYGLAALD